MSGFKETIKIVQMNDYRKIRITLEIKYQTVDIDMISKTVTVIKSPPKEIKMRVKTLLM